MRLMKKQIISLYDYTAEAVKPWAEDGFNCFCYDIQHEETEQTEIFKSGGSITKIKMDLQETEQKKGAYGHEFTFYPFIFELLKRHSYKTKFLFGWPPCFDLAVSGAAHFKTKAEKNPRFQIEASQHAQSVSMLGSLLEVPYLIENPVSRLATLWRKPDYYFHPFEYGGYISESEAIHPNFPDHIAPRDAYSKKTCLWTSDDFVMPEKKPVDCETFGSSRQHRLLGGKSLKTKNIRSATARGFAKAVFEANKGSV